MAKAKFTKNGNVKVTLDPGEYNAIISILDHVRLGHSSLATASVSDIAVSLSEFNDMHFSEEYRDQVIVVENPGEEHERILGEEFWIELP